MTDPKLSIPSLRALLAFRAAARHERLLEAAEALGVTESAVSHQIRQLETSLKVQLFDRSSGRLTLTDAGRNYLERVDPALRELHAATQALSPGRGGGAVRLTLPPSLAVTWLVPRLSSFEARHPGIELNIVTTTRVLDLARDLVDLAIRYGRGDWPGIEAAFLFDDLATPVAAPGLIAPGAAASDALLSSVRILFNRSIPDEWAEWTRARGLAPPAPAGALTVDAIEQALQAAEAGLGLAMGRSPYIEARLARGALVAPFGSAGPTGAAYFLCQPTGVTPTAPARRFARWLRAEAKALQAEQAPPSGPT